MEPDEQLWCSLVDPAREGKDKGRKGKRGWSMGNECLTWDCVTLSLIISTVSRLLTENSLLTEPIELPNVKRHSEGTFSNDYSKYLETRRAQDFVQWLKNSKRNGWVCPFLTGLLQLGITLWIILKIQSVKPVIYWENQRYGFNCLNTCIRSIVVKSNPQIVFYQNNTNVTLI